MSAVIGIFGGTFDPIHLGHVRMVEEAKRLLALTEVRLIPCHQPPHRQRPQLSSQQRLHLLRLATSGIDDVVVDDRELNRQGPSYTIDTLESLRSEYGNDVCFVLLMGADAYSALDRWHRWQDILQHAHIAVFLRPGFTLPNKGLLADLEAGSTKQALLNKPVGRVVFLSQEQADISATEIRKQLADGVVPHQLAPAVRDYIIEHQLYNFKKI